MPGPNPPPAPITQYITTPAGRGQAATTTINPAYVAANRNQYTKQYVDKPAAILAIEKLVGKPLDPVWSTAPVDGPRGTTNVEYGPPVTYRYDNGQSQYVNVSPTGTYQNTMNRVTGMKEFMQSGVPWVLSAALPFAGPKVATAANAINLATAIEQKDPLKILTSGASLYAGLPGSNPSTVSTVKDLNTALKIGSAIDKKDPIAGLAAIAQISGVDPSVATTAQGLSAINAVMSGDPSKILNSFTNFFSSNLFGKNNTSPDVKALPPDQVAALTGDQITDTDNPLLPLEEAPPLPNNNVTEVIAGGDEPVLPVISDKELTSPATSDQAFQDALDRSTTSDIPVENKPIEDVLTDAGLVTDEQPTFTVDVTGEANPLLPLEEAPPLPDNTVTEVDLILKDLEEAPPLPDNTVTEVIAGEDTPLLPLEPASPLPDNTVKEVIADTPGTPVTPKIPVAPKIPVTPKIPTKPVTPVTPTTPVKSTDPVEQLYQTTTQSQPTTLADIQYYLDMTGADISPPTNERNPVESLLNAPTSIEELLRYLRS